MSPHDVVGGISPELGAVRKVRRRPKLSWSMRIGIAVLVILPPKYDPAIRLKEWFDED